MIIKYLSLEEACTREILRNELLVSFFVFSDQEFTGLHEKSLEKIIESPKREAAAKNVHEHIVNMS